MVLEMTSMIYNDENMPPPVGEMAGAFLTSVSLEEPVLDHDLSAHEIDDEHDPSVAPEDAGADLGDALRDMLSDQEARRRELEAYVARIQAQTDATDASLGSLLVPFPDDFLARVQNLVRSSIDEKHVFLADLKNLAESGDGAEGSSAGVSNVEGDPRVVKGLARIRELDEELRRVQRKARLLARGEDGPTPSASSAPSPSPSDLSGSASSLRLGDEKAAFLRREKLKRVLAGEGLTAHMQRNATLGPGARFYTLTEEEDALVSEVMGRSEAQEDENDPYAAILDPLGLGWDPASAGASPQRGERKEGTLAEAEVDVGDAAPIEHAVRAARLAEIDRRLSAYATDGGPSAAASRLATPRPLMSPAFAPSPAPSIAPSLGAASNAEGSATKSPQQCTPDPARELRLLFRAERDVDAELCRLRQSELLPVPSEAIAGLLAEMGLRGGAEPATPAPPETPAAAVAGKA